ncbi:MAG: hypothetical protein WC326_10850 [Candidatus Delongbacteria bacterium]
MQMEPSTRREMLGRLGGLLAGLALTLVPGVVLAVVRKPDPPAIPPPTRPATLVARPPQHAVKRHG